MPPGQSLPPWYSTLYMQRQLPIVPQSLPQTSIYSSIHYRFNLTSTVLLVPLPLLSVLVNLTFLQTKIRILTWVWCLCRGAFIIGTDWKGVSSSVLSTKPIVWLLHTSNAPLVLLGSQACNYNLFLSHILLAYLLTYSCPSYHNILKWQINPFYFVFIAPTMDTFWTAVGNEKW